VHRVPGSSNLFPIRAAVTLARIGRRGGFEAVFCVSWQCALAALIARVFGGPTTILTAAHGRELLFNPFRSVPTLAGAYDALRRLSLRHSTRLYPVSLFTSGLLDAAGMDGAAIEVLPNGADPDRFRPFPARDFVRRAGLAGRPIILTTGRLVPRKGIDVMLEAMPEILRHVAHAVYVVLGTGPEAARLQDLARSLGIRDAVRFPGVVPGDELLSWYNGCDVFVLPVRELTDDVEGFGLVLLEASACARPVVATRCGGLPEAVIDGVTGLLVKPGSPSSLAAAVVHVLREPDLAARLGGAGRRHVEQKANWSRVVDGLCLSIRESLADESSGRSSRPGIGDPPGRLLEETLPLSF
jgi:phosphatidylinositol alpha-1,6-mannosyltransferase